MTDKPVHGYTSNDALQGEHYSVGKAERKIDEWAEKGGELVLPSLPDRVLKAIGVEKKPLKIKENIAEKNAQNHPDLSAEDNKAILQSALFHPDELIQGKPKDKPDYWVLVHRDETNRMAVVEFSSGKENHEVVGWRYANEKAIQKLKENARREGGHFLIPEPESSGSLGLHDVPSGKDNIPPSGGDVNYSIGKAGEVSQPSHAPARARLTPPL